MGITHRELQTMEWHQVVTKFEALHQNQSGRRFTVDTLGGGGGGGCRGGGEAGGGGSNGSDGNGSGQGGAAAAVGFSARDIACRIMRKEVLADRSID